MTTRTAKEAGHIQRTPDSSPESSKPQQARNWGSAMVAVDARRRSGGADDNATPKLLAPASDAQGTRRPTGRTPQSSRMCALQCTGQASHCRHQGSRGRMPGQAPGAHAAPLACLLKQSPHGQSPARTKEPMTAHVSAPHQRTHPRERNIAEQEAHVGARLGKGQGLMDPKTLMPSCQHARRSCTQSITSTASSASISNPDTLESFGSVCIGGSRQTLPYLSYQSWKGSLRWSNHQPPTASAAGDSGQAWTQILDHKSRR